MMHNCALAAYANPWLPLQVSHMEVGAATAVIDELNVCLAAVKDLVAGYYSRQARKRRLKGDLERALERIRAGERTAERLDRLLVLEMAPLHLEVLHSAVVELRRRTAAVVGEAARYAPHDAAVSKASAALVTVAAGSVEGRVSAESVVSVTAAALAAAEPVDSAAAAEGGPDALTAAALAGQPPTRALADKRAGATLQTGAAADAPAVPQEKGMLANLASHGKRLMPRPLSMRSGRPASASAVQPASPGHGKRASSAPSAATGMSSSDGDAVAGVCCFGSPAKAAGGSSSCSGAADVGAAPEGSGVGAAASCWGRSRRVLDCVGGTVFSEISDSQRKLLEDALVALEEACKAIEAARRQVRIAPRRQRHYVRPPLFASVVNALCDGAAPVLVVSGAPALGKSALAQEVQWLVNSQVLRCVS